MKKPEDCTVEEILASIHYWEAPEGILIYSTEEGGVWVNDYEGACGAGGDTLKEALIAHGRAKKNRHRPWQPDEDSEIDWGKP